MSWGETSGYDTFVYDPGKQSANNFNTNANGCPSLKIFDAWKQCDLHLKGVQSYYTSTICL